MPSFGACHTSLTEEATTSAPAASGASTRVKPRLFIKHLTTNREQRETRKDEREEEKMEGLTVAGSTGSDSKNITCEH